MTTLFRLIVEYRPGESTSQQASISQIVLTSCAPPSSSVTCPANSLFCANAACVPPTAVCDYNDDCGDYTDEDDCSEYAGQKDEGG